GAAAAGGGDVMGLPGRRLPLPARSAARAPVLRRVLRAAAAAVLPVMLLAAPAAAQTSPSGGAGEPETPRIAAGAHYVMIVPADGGYRVAETIQLRNTSGTAVDDVTLPLFAGAWDVQFLAGFDERSEERGVGEERRGGGERDAQRR